MGPSEKEWDCLQEGEPLQPTPLCLPGDTAHTTSIPRKGKTLYVLIHCQPIQKIILKLKLCSEWNWAQGSLNPPQPCSQSFPVGHSSVRSPAMHARPVHHCTVLLSQDPPHSSLGASGGPANPWIWRNEGSLVLLGEGMPFWCCCWFQDFALGDHHDIVTVSFVTVSFSSPQGRGLSLSRFSWVGDDAFPLLPPPL